jgi:HTH-type transcriptional regulator, cell division transcriptional repressor
MELTNQPANMIGTRVRWMRERLRLTQDELAGKLAHYGVHLDYVKIGQIENRKRRVVDWELVGFAKSLGVSVNWLLSGDEERL